MLITAVFALPACSEQKTQQPSQVVIGVNKVEITLLQFNNALKTMGVTVPSELGRRETTSKLIDREIATQAAIKAGVDKVPEVLLQMRTPSPHPACRAGANSRPLG